MEAAIIKCLKRVRKEAPRRMTEMRENCDKLIDELSNSIKDSRPNDASADRYFWPFKAACESKHPRLMEVGLDSIHYLIEHGYLTGRTKIKSLKTMVESSVDGAIRTNEATDDENEGSRLTLMDSLIETVNKCAEDFDEGVQIQVIKALLVAVTSPLCEVHEASLLLAIRACFHIHLITKNQVNKTTAKAALTQMLSAVYQKMESIDARAKAETEIALSTIADAEELTVEHERGPDKQAHEHHYSVDGSPDPESAGQQKNFVGTNSTPHLQSASVSFVEGSTDQNSVLENDHRVDTAADRECGRDRDRDQDGLGVAFPSIMHKDAFLLFRALCKLSMKGLHDHDRDDSHSTSSDPIALQNKILSLELLLHTLQTSGPAFRSGERFIHAIRNYLCVSLLGNSTSPAAQVVGLALQIFVVLLDGFKDHLKAEVEVFVSTIFLRILESENSTYDHKIKVLDVFHRICRDSSALVEIFINYDCDLEAIDLFRRIVDGFAKVVKNANSNISQGKAGASSIDFMSSSATKRAVLDELQQLRTAGMKGLIAVLQSLLRCGGLLEGLPADSLANVDLGGIEHDSNYLQLRIVTSAPLKTVDGSSSSITDSQFSSSARDSTNDVESNRIDTTNIVDNFDRKQRVQEDFETGILKFNLSPRKGLAFLSDRGHLEMTPLGVAQFLHQFQERLDKTVVGEYLGREREYEDGFCLKVLHEYVGLMDFTGMLFDLAIRHFLSGFRLPGEAQKIDRLMEKFAERYYLQNSDVFASADMAFILAFSTIMLQTNLHNPAIREDKRMTKDQFIRQNKGISSDGELPDEMLKDIYDRIAAEPISITQDDKMSRRSRRNESADAVQFNMFQASADKRKKEAFNDERKEMVRHGEALFRQASKKAGGSIFVRNMARNGEPYVRPMFEVIWAPVVAVLSQVLETADDNDGTLVDICLTGMYCAIRLACRNDFSTARFTLINTLAKFTTLETVREMHRKHVSCIKLVLEIAFSEADYLDESWSIVLQCVSQLARLQLFANKLLTDDAFFSDELSGTSKVSNNSKRSSSSSASSTFSGFYWQSPQADRIPVTLHRSLGPQGASTGLALSAESLTKFFAGPSRAESARHTEELNAAILMREIDPLLLDKIFLNSSSLNGDSVCHFVRCLCEVSMSEISSSTGLNNLRTKDISCDTANPRIFSLQKLVEVADVNMFCRPRVQWSNMWGVLADYFAIVGVNGNLGLAMFAVDALKQLSIKFLQKDELSNFNFQRIFLRPFEVILSGTKLVEIKDMVLRCIDILIKTSAANIRSGWRSIFKIFEASAREDLEIAYVAFDILKRLLQTQLEFIAHDFVDFMTCLVSFIACRHSDLSVSALHDLSQCADHLADGVIQPARDHIRTQTQLRSKTPEERIEMEQQHAALEYQSHQSGEIQDSEDALVFRVWWPLLLGLSSHVADSRSEVRKTALEELSRVLRKHVYTFSSETWSVIFKGVLFPIVESARAEVISSGNDSGLEWMTATCQSVLSFCCEMYELLSSSGINCEDIFADLTSIFESIVSQGHQLLARMGMEGFQLLLRSPSVGSEANVTRSVCSVLNRIVFRTTLFHFGEELDLSLTRMDWVNSSDILRDWGVYQKFLTQKSSDHKFVCYEDTSVLDTFGTSAEVTLIAGRVISGLIHRLRHSLPSDTVPMLLEAVEAQYIYAVSVNEDRHFKKMCMHLGTQGANPGEHGRNCDMTDQEVQAISTLTSLCQDAVASSSTDFVELFETSFFRQMELKHLSGSSDTILSKLLMAYVSVIEGMLNTILEFSDHQFRRHQKWVISILPDLILSREQTVRSIVSSIYMKHVNPRLLCT